MTDSRRRGRPRPKRHHFLFGVALVLLSLLTAWWVTLLTRLITEEDQLRHVALKTEARLAASELAAAGGPPSVGPLPARDGSGTLEVAEESSTPGPYDARIPGTSLVVKPTEEAFTQLRENLQRRRMMVVGESSMLLVLVGACVAMLIHLMLAEVRYGKDIERFLARVTHEMKTPLAGIKSLLQALASEALPAERVPDLISLGLRQAERQEHLIENLLTANRITARSAPLPVVQLDLGTELCNFVTHRRATMATKDSFYELDCPKGLRARGNSDALLTLLENLADNAEKYGASRLSVVAARQGETVQVKVSDDGDGFVPDHAESLFDAFRRDAQTRTEKTHGTGLGLWISRELAKEMGGDLRAESGGPGQGATFTIELPVAAA